MDTTADARRRYDTLLRDPALSAGLQRVDSADEQLSIQVAGGRTEARAWRDAVDGLIRPPWTDGHGTRHWLVVGRRIVVHVVSQPG